MDLKTVRIRDFRCIEDSEPFSIDRVTCLVGKNESGKTAILKALYQLNPHEKDLHRFEPARDYPRRKWRPDVTVPKDPPDVKTKWELSKVELAVLEKQFGKNAIKQPIFSLSTGYDNIKRFGINIDEMAITKHLVSQGNIGTEEKKKLSVAKTIDELRKELAELEKRTPAAETLYQQLTAGEFKDGASMAVINAVSEMVPIFLYFDQYLRLPGQVAIDALIERKKQNQLTDTDRIFEALLGLAGTTIDKIHGAATFEEFNASLRAVST